MKNLIYILLILTAFSCQEDPCGVEETPTDPHEKYWGCWTTGKAGYYDVNLKGNGSELHTFAIVESCGLAVVASTDIGFFRNDTLILDNGIAEFWCYIEIDTLSFSVNIAGFDADVEKLTKVE